MRFKLKCLKCGHTYWRQGFEDRSVNYWEVDDELGDECPECGGDDYECIDSEYDEPERDDVL